MSNLTAEQRQRIEENKRKALAKRAGKASATADINNKATYGATKFADGGKISSGCSSVDKNYVATGPVKPGSKTKNHGTLLIPPQPLPKHSNNNFKSNVPSLPINSSSSNSTSSSTSVLSANSCLTQKKPPSLSSASTSSSSFAKQLTSCKTPNGNQGQNIPLNKSVTPEVKFNNASNSGKTNPQQGTSVVNTKPQDVNLFYKSKPVKGQCILISRERFEVQVGFSPPLVELFKQMKTKLYDAVSKKWSFKLEEYEKFMSSVKALHPSVEVEPLPKAIIQTFANHIRGQPPSAEIPDYDLSGVDSTIVDALLPFQKTGVNFGISKKGRVLIADDMGLGKTIQAICLAAYYKAEWPLLVVAPSSVKFDWAQQVHRWLPSVDPQTIHVGQSGKSTIPMDATVCILSYDLMARKAEELKRKHYNVIIMDECHHLKNYKTARCKAAMPLLQNSHRVILLSGTPALSRPSELLTQISAICPFLFKHQDFGVRYCDGKKMPWGWDFSGSSNMNELQILLEERIMIRRLKKDVLSQLPSKIRQMVLLDPSSVKIKKDVQKTSVKNLEKLSGMERRGALLEYFNITGKAKINAIRDYVLDLLEADKKFIIFAHHQTMLDAIEEVVVDAKFGSKFIRIDGKTTPEQRSFFCKKFQQSDEIRLAILSITAANAGLNLSAASLVVFAELFWNPGVLVQAEDRAHRIGQKDLVSVHYLVAQGTADDHIWPLVQKKLDVLNKAGLSKDNFSSADTLHVKAPGQENITSYFEESFMEDEESVIEALSGAQDEDLDKNAAKRSTPHKHHIQDTPTKKSTQSSIDGYFSKQTCQHKTDNLCDNVNWEDDLENLADDLDWDDDLEEEQPQTKKIKM